MGRSDDRMRVRVSDLRVRVDRIDDRMRVRVSDLRVRVG